MDNTVTFALCQPLKDCIGGCERCDVDSGIGIVPLPRLFKHLAVDFVISYRHTSSLFSPVQVFSRSQIRIPKPECRMSNNEFRMMKLNLFCCFLRHSLFVIRPARYALK